jgi:hypothetical protein
MSELPHTKPTTTPSKEIFISKLKKKAANNWAALLHS